MTVLRGTDAIQAAGYADGQADRDVTQELADYIAAVLTRPATPKAA